MSVWSTNYPKQYRKGSVRKPLRSSEKAWVDKRTKTRATLFRPKFRHQQSFLDHVRYMRWYSLNGRSYLMCRIHAKPPFYEPPHYAKWPRHIP